MKRRQRVVLAADGSTVPEDVLVFDQGVWPGGSYYQQWLAWDTARREWVEENLPGGMKDLPGWDLMNHAQSIPDQPWEEVEHLI